MFNACVKENKLINLQNIDISDLKINGGKAEIVGDLKIDGENAKIIDNLIINVDKVADVDRDKLKTNDLKYKNENAEIVGDLKIDDENAEVINKLIISSVNEREKKLTVGINEINTENDKLEMVDIGKNKLEIVGIDNGKLNTANVENDKYKNVKDEIDILDYSCNEVLIVDEDCLSRNPITENINVMTRAQKAKNPVEENDESNSVNTELNSEKVSNNDKLNVDDLDSMNIDKGAVKVSIPETCKPNIDAKNLENTSAKTFDQEIRDISDDNPEAGKERVEIEIKKGVETRSKARRALAAAKEQVEVAQKADKRDSETDNRDNASTDELNSESGKDNGNESNVYDDIDSDEEGEEMTDVEEQLENEPEKSGEIIVKCKDKLFMRKDHYLVFIDSRGKPCDDGSKQLLIHSMLPKFSGGKPGDILIHKKNNKFKFGIVVRGESNESSPEIMKNIESELERTGREVRWGKGMNLSDVNRPRSEESALLPGVSRPVQSSRKSQTSRSYKKKKKLLKSSSKVIENDYFPATAQSEKSDFRATVYE
uniref:Uncharacterized protein n=1 Tax=Trichogramma kaykai TaxID=54128 RepID=A0ABD2W7A9_9HYME